MSNPLTDVMPPKYRQAFYALLFLVGLAFAAWQASDGDWTAFALGLVTALGGGTAASNTPSRKKAGRITVGSSGFMTVQADPVEQGRQIAKALDAYYASTGERRRH